MFSTQAFGLTEDKNRNWQAQMSAHMAGIKRKINGDAIATPKKAKLRNGNSKAAVIAPSRIDSSDIKSEDSDDTPFGSDLSADEDRVKEKETEPKDEKIYVSTDSPVNGMCETTIFAQHQLTILVRQFIPRIPCEAKDLSPGTQSRKAQC
jgi:hypothetical protein